MIASICGYFATGSSAVYDLLREYSGLTTGIIGDRDYEHIPFYSPGGLFDLEDKLLIGNSIHRSDEALHTFAAEMERLDKGEFRWCGEYQNLTKGQFTVLYHRFINELIDYKVDSYWSYHMLPDDNTQMTLMERGVDLLRKIYCKLAGKVYAKKRRFRYHDGIWYSFPAPDRFYELGHRFILSYFDMIKGEYTGDLLINMAFLPHNLKRLHRYGLSDLKAIVVDRDLRDVFSYINHNQMIKKDRLKFQRISMIL